MSEHEHIEAEILIFPGARPPEQPDDTWLLMPEYLTDEMIEASGEAIDDYHRAGQRGFAEMVVAMYEAMKAATPKGNPAA